MKKLYTLFCLTLLFLTGCSSDSDSNAATSGDGTGGSTAIFVLKGDYLYAVDDANLTVFSLLNANGPVKINDMYVGFRIETLFADGNYLYVGSRNGMYIYSLEHPENPEYMSSAQHFTACDPVVANNTHAFVTLHSNTRCGNNINQLQIYNIANPQAPQMIHARNLVSPKGLGLYGNYLIVCDDVIKIFDISNAAEPVLATSIQAECHDVIIDGNTLFAIGNRAVFNYTLNAANITQHTLNSRVEF
ncbi:hypothetical protein GR160_17260 [Flavobacterium sp. Sd200]|uniref:hypothetical protein n=1 Tax=Flavobacterium sp. Sd200 TaxID=2692211 RepID=UPI00136AFD04|nr:hypothetical protein [Flavobacterium sp. Sd200]MXN92977.1 hypothetical protein [Flavobacterium sp. Sd200]